MNIDNLDPKCVWKNFYALTQIPRPSKKEWRAVDFMENFGKQLGLETIRDEVGNIIIRKPATPGMEHLKGVILQGHLDMVPQNNNDVTHDWEKDPVETYIDGDWVKAKGTTLGADNGIGCAVAMAILESKDIPHGPVEALFTIDEETGMTGAQALKGGILHGDILINMDSETEGELYVGCAGGLDTDAEFRFKPEDISKGMKQFRIVIKGLRGGHSGMEINEGRANSNKLMVRILLPLLRDMKCELISIEGGNMRNAIPREAEAVIAIPENNVTKAVKAVKKAAEEIKHEYALIDANMEIFMEKTKGAKKIIPNGTALNAVKALLACPCNVDRMSLAIPGLVETSNNLAIVKSDSRKISVKTLMRGSSDSAKYALRDSIRCALELGGAKVKFSGGYSGWQPNMDSEILGTMKQTYQSLFGREPEVKAIHAGLECGILSTNYPHWDMISCGPTLMSPHSPDERLLIPSVERFWQFIKEVLKNIPAK